MATHAGSPSPLWGNGPLPGGIHQFNHSTWTSSGTQRTQYPIVTGTSVLGVKFDGGIAIAADMLGSYGSLARFRDVSRVMKVNETTVLGSGGDYADFQFMRSIIHQRVIDEECLDDSFSYTPRSLFSWLTRVLYNRRSNFNPLWNVFVVGGLDNGEPFLGYADKIGVAYESPSVATGYGAYIALPIIRDALEKGNVSSEADAMELLDRCLRLLYYRDARSLNKYQVAVVTKEGATIKGPITSQTNWEVAHMIKGYE